MNQLDLTLTVGAGREHEAAKMCLARMRQYQWQILRQFAAEVTALGESAAAGERMVVLPASEIGAALSALRLAGRE